MRRVLAGAKKALRRNKRQNLSGQSDSAHLDGLEQVQVNFNLSIEPGPPSGYTCWDSTQCGLCSRFLDRWFILSLFTSKFANVGTTIDLLQWSQAGGRCALCNYLSLRFVEETGGELPLDASIIVRWDTSDTAVENGRKDEIRSFSIELRTGFPTITAKRVMLNCFTKEDQEIGHYITTRPANPDVGSPQAFARASGWLEQCVNGHEQCEHPASGSSEMPTRVLEISMGETGNYSIRLHETQGEMGSYAALSYIWGGPQACRTLKSNFDEHLTQIPSSKMPKTILDAISCTHTLGLRYLWVDSLCIIQDSPDDKAKEIGRMSGIYKNAYVTISAAKAKNCEEGFLHSGSSPEDLFATSFKLEILTPKDSVALNEWIEKYRSRGGYLDYISGFSLEDEFETSAWNHPDAWYDALSTAWLAGQPIGVDDAEDLLTASNIEDEPISKRGWTLQESWLSPRMLIYGSAQLLWKCAAGIQVDGGVPAPGFWRDIRSSYRIDEHGEMIQSDGTKVSDASKEFIFSRIWENVVQEASRRNLTVPGDKLDALEGIVQELRRQTGDEYLAGLWKSRLVRELSWHQDATHIGHESLLCNTERTCPSWSWIKTDGPISFSHAENSDVVVEDAKIVHNQMVGEYPNSRLVVEGRITLRAPISTLPIMEFLPNFKFPNPGTSRFAFTNVIFPDGALTNQEFAMRTIDGEPKVVAPADMKFLELSWGKKGGNQNVANESRGLVLVPLKDNGGQDVFQRVGFYVVALEEDLDHEKLVNLLSMEPGNVRSTAFGKLWKESLREEVVVIV